jgi:hypothetical protein
MILLGIVDREKYSSSFIFILLEGFRDVRKVGMRNIAVARRECQL